MKKEKGTWFTASYHSNRYNAILFDSRKKCAEFAKKKGVPMKGFQTKEEAIQYLGCPESKIRFEVTKQKVERPPRICLCCEKPFHGKTKLCPTCNRLRRTSTPYELSVGTIVTIKAMYPGRNVFTTIKENPHVLSTVWRTTSPQKRATFRKDASAEFTSDDYLKTKYQKTDHSIPDYIKTLISKDESKTLLYLEGDKLNPMVYYLCKRCGQEQCQTYDSLRLGKGHNCDSTKSSGEAIIEAYLKKRRIPYKTQFDTLKCINPKTKKVMPYDFELPDIHALIEVQGDQHYSFIPYFHGTQENFDYQQWKDTQKRTFAESQGYRILYIDYSHIKNGTYQKLIDQLLQAV